MRLEEVPLTVIKSLGRREPFERVKVLRGLQAACKGRPVTKAQMESLSEFVEDQARLRGNEVPSALIGMLALEQLRSVDEVSYLRFASVYKNFDAAGDFVEEMQLLQKQQLSPTES